MLSEGNKFLLGQLGDRRIWIGEVLVAPVPVAPRPAPAMAASEAADLAADLASRTAVPVVADLDTPAPGKVPSRATTSTASVPKPDNGESYDSTAQLTLRGGYAKYYGLGFVAVGGEAAVPVYSGLNLVAGVQVWAVQRALPTDVAATAGAISEWNTIFPINFGVLYKFSAGNTSIIVPVAQILTETRTVACAAMEAAVAILSFAIDKLKRRRAA